MYCNHTRIFLRRLYVIFFLNIENNEGKGIIIYVLKSLYANNINLVSTFKEFLFIEIKLKNKTKLLTGCIYRCDGGGRGVGQKKITQNF